MVRSLNQSTFRLPGDATFKAMDPVWTTGGRVLASAHFRIPACPPTNDTPPGDGLYGASLAYCGSVRNTRLVLSVFDALKSRPAAR